MTSEQRNFWPATGEKSSVQIDFLFTARLPDIFQLAMCFSKLKVSSSTQLARNFQEMYCCFRESTLTKRSSFRVNELFNRWKEIPILMTRNTWKSFKSHTTVNNRKSNFIYFKIMSALEICHHVITYCLKRLAQLSKPRFFCFEYQNQSAIMCLLNPLTCT